MYLYVTQYIVDDVMSVLYSHVIKYKEYINDTCQFNSRNTALYSSTVAINFLRSFTIYRVPTLLTLFTVTMKELP